MTNEKAYRAGVEIGIAMRVVLVIAALVFLIGAAYGQGMKNAKPETPKVEQVKKKVAKAKKKKKSCCCKKVIDKPANVFITINDGSLVSTIPDERV